MDLIDKEKLAADMYKACFIEDYYFNKGMQKWDNGNWIRYKVFEKILEKQPSAEKTGKWIDVENDIDYYPFMCSECYETVIKRTNYCPNCGAKMEG